MCDGMAKAPARLGSMVPQRAPRASSARAWRLGAARYRQGKPQPPATLPPPRGLKRAASEVDDLADLAAFDHFSLSLLL